MMAMDFSGPAAKASPITSASHPHTTSATPPATRSGKRSRSLVVIEVVNAGTPGLQLAVDLHETVDPNLQAHSTEAGSCGAVEVKQFPGVPDVERGVLRRNHGDHDLAVAGDLGQRNAAVEQAENDLGEILVTRRLHKLPLRR